MPWNIMEKNNLQVITINDWLQQGVIAGFSTRGGGVSENCFASLNMGLHVGDNPEQVITNREKYLRLFNLDLHDAVCCQQIHGTRVVRAGAGDRGKGAYSTHDWLAGCDAMITNTPQVLLMTFYADCIPVFFFDPSHRAVGLAHSGWKGTMGRIVVNSLDAMTREFGTLPECVQVLIGPGIAKCCFEIQSDLAQRVKKEFPEFNDIINYSPGGIPTWDLHETNRQLLIGSGVSAENITVANLCTSCREEWFYSYRRDRGQTGRMAALMGIYY